MKDFRYSIRRAEGEFISKSDYVVPVFFAPTCKPEFEVLLRVYRFNKERGEKINKFKMHAIANNQEQAIRRTCEIVKNKWSDNYHIEVISAVEIKIRDKEVLE